MVANIVVNSDWLMMVYHWVILIYCLNMVDITANARE